MLCLWLFLQNCNFENFFTILLRCDNYLGGQTNGPKYEAFSVETCIFGKKILKETVLLCSKDGSEI